MVGSMSIKQGGGINKLGIFSREEKEKISLRGQMWRVRPRGR